MHRGAGIQRSLESNVWVVLLSLGVDECLDEPVGEVASLVRLLGLDLALIDGGGSRLVHRLSW